jgi:hypothetical protein
VVRRAWIVPLIAALAVLSSAGPAGGTRSLAGNKSAARRDAATHVLSVRLPVGASRSPAEPRGDGGTLKPLTALVATTARADARAWWRVSDSPNAVLSYVEAHPPAGAKQTGTGTACSATCSKSVTYDWPAIAGVMGFRELIVTVAPLSGGETGVLASAESDWIVPRPATEKIPKGVRLIAITASKIGGPVMGSFAVTDARQIRRIVSLFDGMPIAQPGAIACPALIVAATTRRITFMFRARAEGPSLARASYIAYAPYMESSGACNAISFKIRGRRQDPLIGGEFLKQVETIVGANVAR